jgi:hypothetical protein
VEPEIRRHDESPGLLPQQGGEIAPCRRREELAVEVAELAKPSLELVDHPPDIDRDRLQPHLVLEAEPGNGFRPGGRHPAGCIPFQLAEQRPGDLRQHRRQVGPGILGVVDRRLIGWQT